MLEDKEHVPSITALSLLNSTKAIDVYWSVALDSHSKATAGVEQGVSLELEDASTYQVPRKQINNEAIHIAHWGRVCTMFTIKVNQLDDSVPNA